MAVTTDILRAWAGPGTLIRDKLAAGVREDRALAVAMGAGLLMFVAQWPRLAREAHLDPSVPLDARMGGTLLASIFILPLALYLVGAISHIIARALGGRGDWFGARLSLFWAMLSVAPAMLLHGLVAGMIGPGMATNLVGALVAFGFLYLWLSMLIEAERGPR